MNTTIIKKVSIALMIFTFLATVSAMAGEKNEQIITGTLEQTNQGIVLSTTTGEHYVVKGKDVSDMVGEQVSATGTVQEFASGKSINVTSIQMTPSDMHE